MSDPALDRLSWRSSIPGPDARARSRVVALALAALALHLGLLALYHGPPAKTLSGDEITYLELATRLAGGERPTSDPLWPPGYPRFAASLLFLAGGRVAAIQWAQWFLLLVAASVVGDLAARWLGDPLARGWAVAACLLYPPLVAFTHYLWPEIPHLFLFVSGLWCLSRPAGGARWPALGGLALGLALLFKSVLLPMIPVFLAPLALRRERRAGALAALLCCAAAVGPVIVTNRMDHGFLGISDSSTFNLRVGLQDRARRSFGDRVVREEYRAWHTRGETFVERRDATRDLVRAQVEAEGVGTILVRQLGRQYHRLFHRDSFLTDQLPGGALAERGWGAYGDVSPAVADIIRLSSYALYALLLAGAAIGLARAAPWPEPWVRVLLLYLGYTLALFLLLHVKSRYRIQMLPVLSIFAAYGLSGLAAEGRRLLSARRWLAAAGPAALLLWLAFGP